MFPFYDDYSGDRLDGIARNGRCWNDIRLNALD